MARSYCLISCLWGATAAPTCYSTPSTPEKCAGADCGACASDRWGNARQCLCWRDSQTSCGTSGRLLRVQPVSKGGVGVGGEVAAPWSRPPALFAWGAHGQGGETQETRQKLDQLSMAASGTNHFRGQPQQLNHQAICISCPKTDMNFSIVSSPFPFVKCTSETELGIGFHSSQVELLTQVSAFKYAVHRLLQHNLNNPCSLGVLLGFFFSH